MSNLILPTIGAGVGYFFGGSTGAQLGWMLGSAAQSSQEEIRQQTVADMRVQTAAYGTSIPYVIGRQRLSGNIIWAADRKRYDIKKRQGKGGPTVVSDGFTVSLAIAICKGPILGISRVWANEELIVDARTEAKPLIGELYLGNQTQMPDPTYEAAVGAGNAPAYRGLAYMVLTDYDLGANPVLPQFSFEVIGGGTL